MHEVCIWCLALFFALKIVGDEHLLISFVGSVSDIELVYVIKVLHAR